MLTLEVNLMVTGLIEKATVKATNIITFSVSSIYKIIIGILTIIVLLGMIFYPLAIFLLALIWIFLAGFVTYAYRAIRYSSYKTINFGRWNINIVGNVFTDWYRGYRRRKNREDKLKYGE